jgi:hypothetical protein
VKTGQATRPQGAVGSWSLAMSSACLRWAVGFVTGFAVAASVESHRALGINTLSFGMFALILMTAVRARPAAQRTLGNGRLCRALRALTQQYGGHRRPGWLLSGLGARTCAC